MTGRPADHAYAVLIGVLVGGFVAWAMQGATGLWWVALPTGLAAAVTLYLALTQRLRRRAQIVTRPVPAWWSGVLEDKLPYFRLLPESRRERFLRRCQIFLAEQRISGVGCEPTDEDRLLLAATAVMMTAGFPDFHFPNTRELLIYPDSFDPDDFSIHEEGEFLGQMLDAGPVIFSLPELRRGFTDEDWTNVAIHELSHVLDNLWSSEAGGFVSDSEPLVREWLRDQALYEAVLAGESPIDDYAFENEQEFFAVTSEVFFEDPALLRELHPDIYTWLAGVYGQDLIALIEAAEGAETPAGGQPPEPLTGVTADRKVGPDWVGDVE